MKKVLWTRITNDEKSLVDPHYPKKVLWTRITLKLKTKALFKQQPNSLKKAALSNKFNHCTFYPAAW